MVAKVPTVTQVASLSQSSLMGAALIAGFILYLGMSGKLGAYWSILTGGTAKGGTAASATAPSGTTTTPPASATNPPAVTPSTPGSIVGGILGGIVNSPVPGTTTPGTPGITLNPFYGIPNPFGGNFLHDFIGPIPGTTSTTPTTPQGTPSGGGGW